MAEVLEELSLEQVKEEVIPTWLEFLDPSSQSQIEVNQSIASIFGKVLHKLSKFDLHLEHEQKFLSYFKEIAAHEDPDIRLSAAFNLPCLHLLYADSKQTLVNFGDLYLRFQED